MSTRKKGVLLCLLLALMLLAAACSGSLADGEKIVVKVPEGATAREVAELLKESGVVSSAELFYRLAQFRGDAETFQYGIYTFTGGMDYEDIVATLRQGTVAEGITITVLPGRSIEAIGTMLEEMNLCTKQEFAEACDTADYAFSFVADIPDKELRRHVLEGYLAAETLEILTTDSARDIVERLLAQTESLLASDGRAERIDELGITVDELLVLASVVEKEADNTADMKRVARVFLNRNAIDMAWESCPTVWYALGLENEATLELLYRQIEEASYPNCPYYRYNTYVMYQTEEQGELVKKPIGPICSPSQAAIDAVLYPADESDRALYFFFDEDLGETRFFDDYDSFYAAAYD